MLITGALAWAYVRFGSVPAAGWLLYGIKPVILAVLAQAIWSLAPRLAVAAAILLLRFKVNSAWLIFGGAAIGWAVQALSTHPHGVAS